MTFSIVAWDAASGALGVAVSTKFLAVGAICPHVRGGVGALAAQALIHPAFGPRALALLAMDVEPGQVLQLLLENDEQRDHRQLHMVDHQGNTAAFTGDEAGAWAGHQTHPSFSVAGNMVAGEETLHAMVKGFSDTRAQPLPFPQRLLSALEAGQAAGGDVRGQQSAALYIAVPSGPLPIDLRVDDHPDPIAELQRIFQKARHEYHPLQTFLEQHAHTGVIDDAPNTDPGAET